MFSDILKMNSTTIQSFVVLGSLCFVAILLCVCSDFVCGVLRSKRSGVPITSKGLRQTVTKIVEYSCTLFVCSIIGALVQYSLEMCHIRLPKIPIFSLFISVCICFIEFKSILENLQDSTKKNAKALYNLFKQLDKSDKERMIQLFGEFLTGEDKV